MRKGSKRQSMTESASDRYALPKQREVFFALISPIGADKSDVKQSIEETLRLIGYDVIPIKISDLLSKLPGVQELGAQSGIQQKKLLMDSGDELRKRFDKYNQTTGTNEDFAGAAAALLGMAELQRTRSTILRGTGDPRRARAFVIDSLKNPSEIEALRIAYGATLYAVGVYAPEDKRRESLERLPGPGGAALIEELLDRDRQGEDPLGQLVQDAFYLCDFFVDASKPNAAFEVRRFIELAFGNPLWTPTMEEMGMFSAYSIQARSGALGRQVGVAILRTDASVVSLGANEVARPISGGQYLPSDDNVYYGRDLVYEEGDTSNWYRRDVVEDLLVLLERSGYLKIGEKQSPPEVIQKLLDADDSPLKKAKIENTIDYMRPVHAEAAALLDAARHGVATLGCNLYTTTFPCHECARHIVAAGIKEVIYLEPYDKSGVGRLYKDSISVDTATGDPPKLLFRNFVGVAPRRYLQYFLMNGRKRKEGGKVRKFSLPGKEPYLPVGALPVKSVLGAEAKVLEDFIPFVESLKSEPLSLARLTT